MAGKSGLLHNNAVEPRPRTMENALFDPTEEDRDVDEVDHFFRRSPAHNDSFPTSPTYEELEDEIRKFNRHKTRPLPSPPLDQITDPSGDNWLSASPSFSPSHSVHPPALSVIYSQAPPYSFETWGLGTGGIHPPHVTAQPFHIPHPKPALNKNLEQATVPCGMSYPINYQNGIPPHHSSNLFKQMMMKRTIALPGQLSRSSQMSDFDLHGHSMMKTSPSILSKALTEPLSISNCSTLQRVIPPREKKRNHFFSGRKKQAKKSKKKREPLPYEVPSKALEVIVSESESKEDTSEKEDVPRPQTSTPKQKSRGKSCCIYTSCLHFIHDTCTSGGCVFHAISLVVGSRAALHLE